MAHGRLMRTQCAPNARRHAANKHERAAAGDGVTLSACRRRWRTWNERWSCELERREAEAACATLRWTLLCYVCSRSLSLALG